MSDIGFFFPPGGNGGNGGNGGGGQGPTYTHHQPVAASTWSVTHSLNTKPEVTVVSPTGDLLTAQVSYPTDNTTVISFGSPYAGIAYLRG